MSDNGYYLSEETNDDLQQLIKSRDRSPPTGAPTGGGVRQVCYVQITSGTSNPYTGTASYALQDGSWETYDNNVKVREVNGGNLVINNYYLVTRTGDDGSGNPVYLCDVGLSIHGTDNHVVRMDGTHAIQDSLAILNDTGDLTVDGLTVKDLPTGSVGSIVASVGTLGGNNYQEISFNNLATSTTAYIFNDDAEMLVALPSTNFLISDRNNTDITAYGIIESTGTYIGQTGIVGFGAGAVGGIVTQLSGTAGYATTVLGSFVDLTSSISTPVSSGLTLTIVEGKWLLLAQCRASLSATAITAPQTAVIKAWLDDGSGVLAGSTVCVVNSSAIYSHIENTASIAVLYTNTSSKTITLWFEVLPSAGGTLTLNEAHIESGTLGNTSLTAVQ